MCMLVNIMNHHYIVKSLFWFLTFALKRVHWGLRDIAEMLISIGDLCIHCIHSVYSCKINTIMDLTNLYRHCLTQSFFFWVHDNGIFSFLGQWWGQLKALKKSILTGKKPWLVKLGVVWLIIQWFCACDCHYGYYIYICMYIHVYGACIIEFGPEVHLIAPVAFFSLESPMVHYLVS